MLKCYNKDNWLGNSTAKWLAFRRKTLNSERSAIQFDIGPWNCDLW
jgi:hypothetical protein